MATTLVVGLAGRFVCVCVCVCVTRVGVLPFGPCRVRHGVCYRWPGALVTRVWGPAMLTFRRP